MEDNRLPLLEQELHNYKEITNREIKEMKEKLDEYDTRLKEIEMSKQKTDYQYEQIMESLKTLNEKTIPNLISQIEELKNKPVKRYDQAITGILGAVFGALGSYIANLIFNK